MMNHSIEIGELIKVLESKGIYYELTGECTKIIWCGSTPVAFDTYYGLDLGIQIKDGVYAWYLIRGIENNCANEYWFKHRYNANIGHSLKGWKTGYKITQKLESLLEVKLGV
ncbi:hypothetical protein AAKU52_002611 [Pedobacter sp. CG_S7]|uniref:hypothetical protein n=1 Tax=Pedobacter sp. CG_S7 TaxID=3143930 RepID=UPI003392D317